MKQVEDYINLPYIAIATTDEGVDGKTYYRAEHPQLPGCMSHGATQEEAFANLAEARRLYIQTLLDLGRDVPVPVVSTITTYSADSSFMVIPMVAVEPVVETTIPSVIDMAKQAA
jgi:predicted RNase H-like HicB family nuclease